MKKEDFVISLGGSIIFPGELNIPFLKKFSNFIKREIKKGKRFIIVAGGGELARHYQKRASRICQISNEEKDWLGILATKINAYLLKAIFKKFAHPQIFDKRKKIKKFQNYPLIMASGWKPGRSTDFVAVQIAADFKLNTVINIGKAPYVYTKDFRKYPEAKPIKAISWLEYLNLISSSWRPGLHVPIDPVAAKLAKREKIKVIVVGEDLKNLKKVLEGKNFKGTILE